MALAGLVPPTDLQPRSYLVRHECNQITASDSTLIGCWCSAYLQLRNSLCEKGHKKDATLTPSHGGANLRLAFQSKLTLECVPVKTDFWYVPVKTLKGWRPAPVALHLHLAEHLRVCEARARNLPQLPSSWTCWNATNFSTCVSLRLVVCRNRLQVRGRKLGSANSSHVEKTCAIPTAKYLFLDFDLLSTNTKASTNDNLNHADTPMQPTRDNGQNKLQQLYGGTAWGCDWTNKRGGGGEKNQRNLRAVSKLDDKKKNAIQASCWRTKENRAWRSAARLLEERNFGFIIACVKAVPRRWMRRALLKNRNFPEYDQ